MIINRTSHKLLSTINRAGHISLKYNNGFHEVRFEAFNYLLNFIYFIVRTHWYYSKGLRNLETYTNESTYSSCPKARLTDVKILSITILSEDT